ncbi:hypothetical protein BT69DRAFT_449018 [Atractiella rhizophila]|nr:hypothetical protein BT69DRAFT_449018 [Atractiella rhizophila]
MVRMLYALSRFPRQRPLKLNMVRKVRPADIIRYMLDDGFDPLSSTVLINSILSAEQELTWIYRPPWKIAHPEREPKSYIAATALLQRHAPTFAIFQLMLKDKLVPNGQTFKHVLTSRFRVRNMIEDYGIGPSAPDFIPRSPEVEAPEILNVLSLPPPFQIRVPKPRAILREMLRVRCSSHSFRSWQARMKNQSKDVWNAGIAELAIKFFIHEEDWVAAWLVAQHVRNRFRWGAPVDLRFTDDFSVHRILANLTERWTEGMVPALLDNFGSIDPNSEMGIVFEAFVTLGREHGYVEIQKLRPRAKSLLEGSKGRELLARFLRYCDPAPTGEEWHGKVEQCLKDILPVEEDHVGEEGWALSASQSLTNIINLVLSSHSVLACHRCSNLQVNKAVNQCILQ